MTRRIQRKTLMRDLTRLKFNDGDQSVKAMPSADLLTFISTATGEVVDKLEAGAFDSCKVLSVLRGLCGIVRDFSSFQPLVKRLRETVLGKERPSSDPRSVEHSSTNVVRPE